MLYWKTHHACFAGCVLAHFQEELSGAEGEKAEMAETNSSLLENRAKVMSTLARSYWKHRVINNYILS